MEATAKLKGARISAQKARLVADQVRGMAVERADELLNFSAKKGAHIVRKVLLSAVANAENNLGADIDELKVSRIFERPLVCLCPCKSWGGLSLVSKPHKLNRSQASQYFLWYHL